MQSATTTTKANFFDAMADSATNMLKAVVSNGSPFAKSFTAARVAKDAEKLASLTLEFYHAYADSMADSMNKAGWTMTRERFGAEYLYTVKAGEVA